MRTNTSAHNFSLVHLMTDFSAVICYFFKQKASPLIKDLDPMFLVTKAVQSSPAVNAASHVIDFFVQFIPPEVLPSIFNGCDGHYNTNWDHRHLWLESIHHWHKIQQCNEHKINIGKAVKLLIDIFREES